MVFFWLFSSMSYGKIASYEGAQTMSTVLQRDHKTLACRTMKRLKCSAPYGLSMTEDGVYGNNTVEKTTEWFREVTS